MIEPCSKAAADESDEAEESSREHEFASSPFIESRADKDTAKEKNEHLGSVSWRLGKGRRVRTCKLPIQVTVDVGNCMPRSYSASKVPKELRRPGADVSQAWNTVWDKRTERGCKIEEATKDNQPGPTATIRDPDVVWLLFVARIRGGKVGRVGGNWTRRSNVECFSAYRR